MVTSFFMFVCLCCVLCLLLCNVIWLSFLLIKCRDEAFERKAMRKKYSHFCCIVLFVIFYNYFYYYFSLPFLELDLRDLEVQLTVTLKNSLSVFVEGRTSVISIFTDSTYTL